MRFINALVACSVIAITSTAALSQSSAVQWTVASGGNGHWYEAVRDQGAICWGYAKLKCEELGGHLAALTSPNEREFVRSQLASGPWYFLGGYQDLSALDFIEPDGGWRWVTGEPWTPLWAEGQPENGGGNQDTVCIYNTGIHDVAQCDEQGGGWRYYVIEYSADCNADGIVDYGQILSGQLIDANSNGIPDICDVDPCPGDISGNGAVDGVDLTLLLGVWGTDGIGGKFDADITNDGIVGGADLTVLFSGWGPCPN